MKKIIKLTESQVNKMIKQIVSEQPIIPLSQQTDINSQNVNTSSWERKKPFNLNLQVKITGKENFKMGEDQIEIDAPQVKKAISDIKKLSNSGGGKVVVNGSASNTKWGQFGAGSSEAKKKNTELAGRRRDNMINYLNGLNLKNITFTKGVATVSDSDKPENQNITLDMVGSEGVTINPKGDIGDNTRTSPKLYDKVLPKKTDIIPTTSETRVCTKIPKKYLSELKRVIYNWGKTKNLKLPISDKSIK